MLCFPTLIIWHQDLLICCCPRKEKRKKKKEKKKKGAFVDGAACEKYLHLIKAIADVGPNTTFAFRVDKGINGGGFGGQKGKVYPVMMVYLK
jgi:hypothetical protein